MPFPEDNIAELHVFMLFDLSSGLEGIKIHKTADKSLISAAKRLYENGFITQVDGGYLTELGTEAAEHTQALQTMLSVN